MVSEFEINQRHENIKINIEEKMIPSASACEAYQSQGLFTKEPNEALRKQKLAVRGAMCRNKRSSGIMIVIGLILIGIGVILTLYYAFDTVNSLSVTRIGLTVGLILALVGVVLIIGGYSVNNSLTKGIRTSNK